MLYKNLKYIRLKEDFEWQRFTDFYIHQIRSMVMLLMRKSKCSLFCNVYGFPTIQGFVQSFIVWCHVLTNI